MNTTYDVVIAGGGAIGASIAYHLARRGVCACVVEKESVGARASGKAWAVVSYPPYILLTSRYENTYFHMPGDSVTHWQELYWAAYLRMADLAAAIADKTGIDIEYGLSPITMLAFSERSAGQYHALLEGLHESGCHEGAWLDAADLRSEFPGLDGKVCGGLSVPQVQIEPYKYTTGLALAAEAMGAHIRLGEVVDFMIDGDRVSSVVLASGEKIGAGRTIIAMGPWSGVAAARLGWDLPVWLTMEECLRIRPRTPLALHSLVGGVEMLPRVNGDITLATAEVRSKAHYFESKHRTDLDARLSEDVRNRNIEAAVNLLPDLLADAELVEHRGDLLAYGPPPLYQKPVLGRLPRWENAYIATRFGGMGIDLSVGVGQLMADTIADGAVPYNARHLMSHLSPAA